jgi:hypothetical protein
LGTATRELAKVAKKEVSNKLREEKTKLKSEKAELKKKQIADKKAAKNAKLPKKM